MRTDIKRKLSQRDILRRVIFGIAILFAIFPLSKSAQLWQQTFIIIFIFIAFDQIIVSLTRGYRISYDDQRIYMRPGGLRWNLRYYPEVSLAYDDIEIIQCGFGTDPGGIKQRFQPFDQIRIYGDVDQGEDAQLAREHWDYILIIPDLLRRYEGMGFLHDLHAAYPEKFDPFLAQFMESGEHWEGK